LFKVELRPPVADSGDWQRDSRLRRPAADSKKNIIVSFFLENIVYSSQFLEEWLFQG